MIAIQYDRKNTFGTLWRPKMASNLMTGLLTTNIVPQFNQNLQKPIIFMIQNLVLSLLWKPIISTIQIWSFCHRINNYANYGSGVQGAGFIRSSQVIHWVKKSIYLQKHF